MSRQNGFFGLVIQGPTCALAVGEGLAHGDNVGRVVRYHPGATMGHTLLALPSWPMLRMCHAQDVPCCATILGRYHAALPSWAPTMCYCHIGIIA